MTCYFYKNKYNEVISFISCTWLEHEIDLVNSSTDATTPICHLTVVNSAQDCYKGTVTYKDLDDFKHGTVTLDTLNTLIKVGLQGAERYQGDKIVWKTVFDQHSCQMTLLGFLQDALPVKIGTFQIDRVPDSNKPHIWMEWMENTTSQFKISRETQDALTLRNDHLEKEFKQMETVAEDLVVQKTSNDLILMAKFKELLNQKKRKIRRLAMELEKVKDTRESNIPPETMASQGLSSSTKPTGKKRKRSVNSSTQSQLESQVPDEPIVKKSKLNTDSHHTTSPPTVDQIDTIPPVPNNNDKKDSTDNESDGSSNNDLLLTTTRSRLRKFAHTKRPSEPKSDPGSDTTDDDDA
ncbi:hypothetical protein BC941DRAFT_23056 [Chlamydoabsidia padenii]|nr:hypothetical protein BC941DRAFT_23056 [Chlamydoabsidia padenii]